MNITINTKILQKHHLSLGEFLLMLLSYFDINLEDCQNSIIKKTLAQPNVIKRIGIVLSNNDKDLVAQILLESNEKVINSGIYPESNKPGTTHKWRGTTDMVAQKLRTLVAVHDFHFTPEEAIQATKNYISSFEPPYQDMLLLRSFLLTTRKSSIDDISEIDSLFMTYIENNR